MELSGGLITRGAIIFGGDCSEVGFPGAIDFGGNCPVGNFPGAIIFDESFQTEIFLDGNSPGAIVLGGNCLGGNYRWGNYLLA